MADTIRRMHEPEVSICIRGWRGDLFAEAARSALDQTFEDLEVVVTDDSGECEEVAASLGDPRIRYFRNPARLGPTPNAAAALDLARGRFIGLLNDDDRLLPRYAERLVGALRSDQRVGVAFAHHLCDDGGRIFPRARHDFAAGTHEVFLPELLRSMPVPTSAALMRREVWELVRCTRPLRPDAPPDMPIWVGAAAAGWAFHYVDEPLMVWRMHARALSNEPIVRDRFVALWQAFSFEDPECERLRLRRLASSHISRAGLRLQQGNSVGACSDLGSARAAAPGVERSRRVTLSTLARVPKAMPLALLAWKAFRRLRPWRPPYARGV